MTPRAYVTVGLAFGDEGKGATVDYLARLHGALLVVRYSGGPQAGHNVVLEDGRRHRFSQFGSASFLPGVRTHLSRHMLVEPYAMANEAEVFNRTMGEGDVMERTSVDPLCPVITPYHWMLNRLREEARGEARHGSCGMGVGELRAMQATPVRTLEVCHLGDYRRTAGILADIKECVVEQARGINRLSPYCLGIEGEDVHKLAEFYKYFIRRIRLAENSDAIETMRNCVTVFEGAQGVLLDEDFGFVPHNTWTKTTAANANVMIRDAGIPSTTVGVVRTYFTRHGPGPFVSECEPSIEDRHNGTAAWQGRFRTGLFDLAALRYSLRYAGGVDEIALTCIDQVGPFFEYVDAYRMPDGRIIKNVGELGTPCPASDLDGAAPIVEKKRVGGNSTPDIFQELIGLSVSHVSWGETATQRMSRIHDFRQAVLHR